MRYIRFLWNISTWRLKLWTFIWRILIFFRSIFLWFIFKDVNLHHMVLWNRRQKKKCVDLVPQVFKQFNNTHIWLAVFCNTLADIFTDLHEHHWAMFLYLRQCYCIKSPSVLMRYSFSLLGIKLHVTFLNMIWKVISRSVLAFNSILFTTKRHFVVYDRIFLT